MGTAGIDTHHTCVSKKDIIEHEDEDCWWDCDKKSGFCGWCGAGACCRGNRWKHKAWREDTPPECIGVGGEKTHACVAPAPIERNKKLFKLVGFEKFEDVACGQKDTCVDDDRAYIVKCDQYHCKRGSTNDDGVKAWAMSTPRCKAMEECGRFCSKNKACEGFSWHDDACWFLKNPTCDSEGSHYGYPALDSDCYMKESGA